MPPIYRPYNDKTSAQNAAKAYQDSFVVALLALLKEQPLSPEAAEGLVGLPYGSFEVETPRHGTWCVVFRVTGKRFPEPKEGFDVSLCAARAKEAYELHKQEEKRQIEEARIRRQERTIDERLEEIVGEELLQAYQVRTQITGLRPSEGTVNFKIAVEGIPEADLDFLVYTLRVALQRHLNAKRKAKEG